jgi:hypothetical protein
MTVQAPTSPAHGAGSIRNTVQVGYMSGFGNDFETEALPGASCWP